MAKDGAKGGKGKKSGRLPKRVAGVKLSREWRRGGEALIAQAQSPAGRAAIVQGVSVIAGIAATAARAAAQSATAKAEAAAAPDAPAGPAPGDTIAQAVTAGIDAALGRLFPRS